MAPEKRGLGRGIDSLFRNSTEQSESSKTNAEITRLPLAALTPCPAQPRQIFEERPLEELAESIKNQGIVQPLLVRPLPESGKYQIVAGERRYRAAKMAGLTEVPVTVRELSDQEALTLALVENLQREDLNPIEEAEAMQALRESLGESQDVLASRLGKSRSSVANALRLLQLPQDMRQALAGNLFTPGHARAVLSVQDEEVQHQLFEAIIDRQLSVRDAETAAMHYKRHGALPQNITEGTPVRAGSARSAKPELVQDAQRLLRVAVHPKVTVSGTGKMGRVTIPYESPGALADLLRRLGGDQGAIGNPVFYPLVGDIDPEDSAVDHASFEAYPETSHGTDRLIQNLHKD